MCADRGECLCANKPHEHSTFRARACINVLHGCATCQAVTEPITRSTMQRCAAFRAPQQPCHISRASSEALQHAEHPRIRRHMAILSANGQALQRNRHRAISSQHPSRAPRPKSANSHSVASWRPRRPLLAVCGASRQRPRRKAAAHGEESSEESRGKQGKAGESSEESSEESRGNSHWSLLCFPLFLMIPDRHNDS